jgi:predicted rRNA methylase YqxC with S4 and FtsJ domains
MGLSIHYSGHIRDKKLLDSLIEEVKDICETLNWAPQTIDDDEIKGICYAP